jgi:hypothetical protein
VWAKKADSFAKAATLGGVVESGGGTEETVGASKAEVASLVAGGVGKVKVLSGVRDG